MAILALPVSFLASMAGGIASGIAGRQVNKTIDGSQVEKLFIALMVIIIGISCCNTWAFAHNLT